MGLHSWVTAAKGYTNYLLSTGKSAGTVRTYSSDVHLFWDWCDERELDAFCCPSGALREWFACRVQEVSSSRAIGTLAALRAFYAWGLMDGFCVTDPTKGLRAKRGKQVATVPMERNDFTALLKVCDCERDRAMLMLMAHTGLRITELATLTPESFDWDRKLIKVDGKGSKQAYVAAPDEVLGMCRNVMGFFPVAGEGIWRSEQKGRSMAAHQLRKIMYRLAMKAGIEAHPHRFRSMFAVEHYKIYHDIERLRRAMRHADITTTQRYITHLEDEPVFEQVRGLRLTG
jgi:site-specific recombinase XerD